MIKSLLNEKEMRHTKWFLGCLGLLLSANVAFAQDKAAYFNRNLHVANQLNPAILPERGYLALPFIGGFRIDGATDFTNLSDLIYAISADEKVLNDDSFYDQMKPDNRMNLDMNVNVLSVGWWRGARNTGGERMPRMILICGRVCSGKTTYAKRIARAQQAVRFNADELVNYRQ